jgi:hypothetical protein
LQNFWIPVLGRRVGQGPHATRNEHLVPFANGVLDLDRLRLRPGQPSDMVLRGPPYAWVDYGRSDGVVEEMERMLTQIFTDRDVLAFFLEPRPGPGAERPGLHNNRWHPAAAASPGTAGSNATRRFRPSTVSNIFTFSLEIRMAALFEFISVVAV